MCTHTLECDSLDLGLPDSDSTRRLTIFIENGRYFPRISAFNQALLLVVFFKYKFSTGFSKIEMFVSVLTENRLYFVIVSWFSGYVKIIVNPVFAHSTI